MSSWLVVLGAVGIVCSLAALLGLGMTVAKQGHMGMALAALSGFSVIIGLTLFALEYADQFWKGS